MSSKLEWKTIQMRVTDLIPQEINPRKISTKQMKNLEKSLKKYNLVEIPAVNSEGKIISGHQRVLALKALGRGDEMIDVRSPLRPLTEEEEKGYQIASNAISGEWEYDLLKSFDVELLLENGIEDQDVLKIWSEPEVKNDSFDEDDELKKITTPTTELGDLIILGKHKLLCASCTDQFAVQKLFGEDKASAIYSDPPFNINLSYRKGVGGANNKRDYGDDIDDNKDPEEYKTFIRNSMLCALNVAHKDVHVAYWCDEAWVWVFQTINMELGIKNRRLNIWVKNNASVVPSVAFNKCIECCVYGTRGAPYLSPLYQNLNEIQNKELTNGNELLNQLSNIWATKRLPSNQMEHPTSKNPELHEKFLNRCTKHGDIIFDSFSGSASTMVAAEKLGRIVYSTELQPVFCDLAIRRYEKLTGNKAKIIKKFYEKK